MTTGTRTLESTAVSEVSSHLGQIPGVYAVRLRWGVRAVPHTQGRRRLSHDLSPRLSMIRGLGYQNKPVRTIMWSLAFSYNTEVSQALFLLSPVLFTRLPLAIATNFVAELRKLLRRRCHFSLISVLKTFYFGSCSFAHRLFTFSLHRPASLLNFWFLEGAWIPNSCISTQHIFHTRYPIRSPGSNPSHSTTSQNIYCVSCTACSLSLTPVLWHTRPFDITPTFNVGFSTLCSESY